MQALGLHQTSTARTPSEQRASAHLPTHVPRTRVYNSSLFPNRCFASLLPSPTLSREKESPTSWSQDHQPGGGLGVREQTEKGNL